MTAAALQQLMRCRLLCAGEEHKTGVGVCAPQQWQAGVHNKPGVQPQEGRAAVDSRRTPMQVGVHLTTVLRSAQRACCRSTPCCDSLSSSSITTGSSDECGGALPRNRVGAHCCCRAALRCAVLRCAVMGVQGPQPGRQGLHVDALRGGRTRRHRRHVGHPRQHPGGTAVQQVLSHRHAAAAGQGQEAAGGEAEHRGRGRGASPAATSTTHSAAQGTRAGLVAVWAVTYAQGAFARWQLE